LRKIDPKSASNAPFAKALPAVLPPTTACLNRRNIAQKRVCLIDLRDSGGAAERVCVRTADATAGLMCSAFYFSARGPHGVNSLIFHRIIPKLPAGNFLPYGPTRERFSVQAFMLTKSPNTPLGLFKTHPAFRIPFANGQSDQASHQEKCSKRPFWASIQSFADRNSA
jgi:hypothetical protein